MKVSCALSFNKSQGVESSMASDFYLSYEMLEDVMLLPFGEYKSIVDRARVLRIGPLVEYAYHHYQDLRECLKSRADNPAASLVLNTFAERPILDTSISARSVEFTKAPQTTPGVEEPNWIAFCLRFVDAGVKAGLSKTFAQALVSTLEEMSGNLLDHSKNVSSGLVGYRWSLGEFEYVIADAGIGVLQSLTQHPDYSFLMDSGEALETALTDGESCHGRDQHRGTGFNKLMFNIAQRNSYLRFRSGDHSLSIDGTLPIPLKRTAPCAPFEGFLISIISKPKNLLKKPVDNNTHRSYLAH